MSLGHFSKEMTSYKPTTRDFQGSSCKNPKVTP